jgi:predicted DNA-binding transcriptional regulator AlpA
MNRRGRALPGTVNLTQLTELLKRNSTAYVKRHIITKPDFPPPINTDQTAWCRADITAWCNKQKEQSRESAETA